MGHSPRFLLLLSGDCTGAHCTLLTLTVRTDALRGSSFGNPFVLWDCRGPLSPQGHQTTGRGSGAQVSGFADAH